MIALSGVLRSCVTFARNWLLTRFASSVRSFSRRRLRVLLRHDLLELPRPGLEKPDPHGVEAPRSPEDDRDAEGQEPLRLVEPRLDADRERDARRPVGRPVGAGLDGELVRPRGEVRVDRGAAGPGLHRVVVEAGEPVAEAGPLRGAEDGGRVPDLQRLAPRREDDSRDVGNRTAVDEDLLDPRDGGRGRGSRGGGVEDGGPAERGEPELPVPGPEAGRFSRSVALGGAEPFGDPEDRDGDGAEAARLEGREVGVGDARDAAVARQPEVPEPVVEDLVDGVVVEAVLRGEGPEAPVPSADEAAAEGPSPERAVRTFADRVEGRLRQPLGRSEGRDLPLADADEPSPGGAGPDRAVARGRQDPQSDARQAVRGPQGPERRPVAPREPGVARDPESPGGVLRHAVEVVARQAAGDGGGLHRVPHDRREPSLRRGPDDAVPVLVKADDRVVRQAFPAGEGPAPHPVRGRRGHLRRSRSRSGRRAIRGA